MKHQLLALALITATASLPAQNMVATGNRAALLMGPRVEIPGPPVAFTSDGDHLWVGYGSNAAGAMPGLLKMRRSDNSVVSQVSVKTAPSALCWDGSSLWVADGIWLTRRVGNVTYSYVVPGGNPWSVAANGVFLYVVANKAGILQVLIYRLTDLADPLPGVDSVLQMPTPVEVVSLGPGAARPMPMVVIKNEAVLLGTDKGLLSMLVPISFIGNHMKWASSSSTVLSMFARDGRAFWLAEGVKGLLSVDYRFAQPSTRLDLPFSPTAIGTDGVATFIGYDTGLLDILNLGNSLNVGGAPTAITFDGSYLWVASSAGSKTRWFLNKM